MSKCTCGCTVIDEDHVLGTRVCHECGIVLEENTLVSELTFQETSGGGSVMVGRMIYEDRLNQLTLPMLQDSREVTLANAKKKMMIIANQLNLNQNCVNTALRFYKLALHLRLTIGRPLEQVTASLLYLACRLDGAPYMLLDFCDVVEVNLYSLGRTFVFFCRSLYINLPSTDPSIYVLRFARSLKFGEKENMVVTLALRIVKRLQRDWIAIGRRPAGICGAALLLAGRFYKFDLSIEDIANVVHVCLGVLKNRLKEFAKTPSAKLTLREFALIDLEEECDPPCFKRVIKEVMFIYSYSNLQLHKEKRKRGRPRLPSFSHIPGIKETSETKINEEREECNASVTSDTEKPCSSGALHDDSPVLPSLKTLGIKSQRRRAENTEIPLEREKENKDAVDSESAVSNYLLTENEILHKTEIWTRFNSEFLEKERLKEAEQPETEKTVKKRSSKKRTQTRVAETVNEAIGQIIQRKRLSKMINYDMLVFSSSDEETDTNLRNSVKRTGSTSATQQERTTEMPSPSSLTENKGTNAEHTVEPELVSVSNSSAKEVNALPSGDASIASSQSPGMVDDAEGSPLPQMKSSTEVTDGQQTKRKFFRYKVKPIIPPQRPRLH
ncbi:transcription factor IIIB 90 kDa subunit [Trichuris trichiura]|uniref:B-related factor 1 n=1 Tax=Trichuris trichiura TaxID=36087 RepID=A0A077ZBU4_TRITR|nr:transcription factor IIIB 90 kDa subunit [Trichuris trichiura]